jgi:hypothetical protein
VGYGSFAVYAAQDDTMRLLYFHGFASSPASAKITAIRPMLALVALSIARRGIVAPMVLIAPAFGIADRWLTRLPDGDPIRVFNHARKAEVPIHRRFFEQMFNVRVDAEPPPSRVTVIMGRNDESVPFELVHDAWQRWVASGRLADGSKFIEVADGDHGLTAHTDLIVREIRNMA